LRQPVDGEAGAVLRLALLADGVRPLVARKKFQIGEGVLAVLAILRPGGFEALLPNLNTTFRELVDLKKELAKFMPAWRYALGGRGAF
jgi:hypothetical protein